MDKVKLWNSFLEKIKPELSPMAFDTWFSSTELYDLNNDTAKVLVPYHVTKKNLKEN